MAKKICNKTYLECGDKNYADIKLMPFDLKGKLSLSPLFPLHSLHQVPKMIDLPQKTLGYIADQKNQVQLTDFDCTFVFFFISKYFSLQCSREELLKTLKT